MALTILNYIFIGIFVIFFFGFCIFVHELGHFLAAKWRKMHIVAFSIGFKKIWGFKYNGTEYRIGCLPAGGYVDIPQLDCTGTAKDAQGNQLPKVKPTDRIIVAFAGPFFNILFGFFLATILWIYGIPQSSPKMKSITIAEILKNSPEYNAGLRENDKIVKINKKCFDATWETIVTNIVLTIGKVNLEIIRNGTTQNFSYIPKINPESPFANEGLPYPFFKPEIPVIIQVGPNSEAAKQGLENNDRILQINNKRILCVDDMVTTIMQSNGQPITILILRKNENIKLKAHPTPLTNLKKFAIGIFLNEKGDLLQVLTVNPDSIAEKSGIKPGDIIIKAGDINLTNNQQFVDAIQGNKNKELSLLIKRDNKLLKINVIPKLFIPYQISGISVVFYNHINPWEQFTNVIQMSYKSIVGIFSPKSSVKLKHMSGPVGLIAVISTAILKGSIFSALNIITIITFSLALINLFPLPVLDGGHILLSIVELIIRRSIPANLIQPVYAIFTALLITLMLFVTFNDVNRLTSLTKFLKQHFQQVKEKGKN